jgi:hypothetical protein
MKLITRAEWNARSPRGRRTGHLDQASTGHWNGDKILVATSIAWDHNVCASIVRGIQNFHMDGRGWADIAYNFLECPHGYTFEGRGLNVINAANGTNFANGTSHAIMCLAGVGNPFPDAEKVGFRQTVRYIADQTAAPDDCVGHRDHKATACPGDERYNWIRQGMPVSITPSLPIVKIGMRGEIVRRIQIIIRDKAGGNIFVDGIFGPNTEKRVKDLQRFFGLVPDGIVGPKTWGVLNFLASS